MQRKLLWFVLSQLMTTNDGLADIELQTGVGVPIDIRFTIRYARVILPSPPSRAWVR